MGTRRTSEQVNQSIGSHLAAARRAGQCLVARDHNSRRTLDRWVKRGLLVSPASGCYEQPKLWYGLSATDQSLCIMRSLQLKNPGLVFCGPSAAVAWGLYEPCGYIARPYAATPRCAHASSSRSLVRVCLPSGLDVEEVAGIRVTSLERTTFDAARMLGFRRGLGVCDRALALDGCSNDELLEGFRGMGRARDREVALRCALNADGLSENGGESYARAVMLELGFTPPLLQVPVADPMGEGQPYRLDYLWIPADLDAEKVLGGLAAGTLLAGGVAGCVAGELDGRAKTFDKRLTGDRDARDQLLAERRREARLTYYGLRVARFSFAEARDDAYLGRLLSSYGVPRAPSS